MKFQTDNLSNEESQTNNLSNEESQTNNLSNEESQTNNLSDEELQKDELLYLACCNDDIDTVRSLLFTSANCSMSSSMNTIAETVNLNDNHWYNCLFASAVRGHDNIIALLVENGVNVNLTDQAGWNALHYAYAGKKPSTIELLHSLGVQSIKDSNGYLPHEHANL